MSTLLKLFWIYVLKRVNMNTVFYPWLALSVRGDHLAAQKRKLEQQQWWWMAYSTYAMLQYHGVGHCNIRRYVCGNYCLFNENKCVICGLGSTINTVSAWLYLPFVLIVTSVFLPHVWLINDWLIDCAVVCCNALLWQESCAIAKMTARCALYKWIEWAVVEIWPFEIIQDGGLPPTWIWCNRK